MAFHGRGFGCEMRFVFALTLLALCALSYGYRPAPQLPFSEEKAAKYAILSALSHCSQNTLKQWSCEMCQKNVSMYNVSGFAIDEKLNLFGFVGFSQEEVVISFRGSEFDHHFINWIMDGEFVKKHPLKSDPQIGIHSGFWAMYSALIGQVRDIFINKTPPRPLVTVTGHSMGGAVALLTALNITDVIADDVDLQIYNYGTPRVGNEKFAEFAQKQILNAWRIVNQKDPVPHLPMQNLDFQHSITEVWYTNDTYNVCHGPEDPLCSNSQVNTQGGQHGVYPPFPPGVHMDESSCK